MMISAGKTILSVPRVQIRPFVNQPRDDFAYERLRELADSLRERGQLQPVILRETGDLKIPYELVDGERRWRAAQLADMSHLLAIVSDVGSGDDQYVLSVIANSAREDLSPVEQSRAVARVAAMPKFKALPTQDGRLKALAQVFGRSTSWVTSMAKLNGVAPEVKTLVEQRALPVSSAVQLASVKSPTRQTAIGQRVAAAHLRQSAADSAVRNAVRVEQVREGKTVKLAGTAQKSTSQADMRLVEELVGKMADTAESLLDLPLMRLRAAFGDRPKEAEKSIARVRAVIEALEHLEQALEKISEGQT